MGGWSGGGVIFGNVKRMEKEVGIGECTEIGEWEESRKWRSKIRSVGTNVIE